MTTRYRPVLGLWRETAERIIAGPAQRTFLVDVTSELDDHAPVAACALRVPSAADAATIADTLREALEPLLGDPTLSVTAAPVDDDGGTDWSRRGVSERCDRPDSPGPLTAPDLLDDDLARCRMCGCTEDEPCDGGCSWVPDPWQFADLCSACLPATNAAAAPLVEHALLMSGGGWHLRPDGMEEIYPLANFIRNAQRRGSTVGRRTVVVVQDWHEVAPPTPAEDDRSDHQR